MRKSYVFQSLRARLRVLSLLLGVLAVFLPGRAAEELPFDPAMICRLSVDNIPRSISIRQGADVWLGYDLERAVVFKVWQAPEEKPGLILEGFKAESAGVAWFEGKASEGWVANQSQRSRQWENTQARS